MPFDHKSQLVTRFKPLEPTTEPIMIEPQGQAPFLIYCDSTLREEASKKDEELPPWIPERELLEQ